ncbi:MAG: tripartite tricarboxylate transporter substrate binding protein [Candidimonas sp.]|nr:MAG: tripartite tricarboxylate transporter substrate binding protein [Candidimonas sp.]
MAEADIGCVHSSLSVVFASSAHTFIEKSKVLKMKEIFMCRTDFFPAWKTKKLLAAALVITSCGAILSAPKAVAENWPDHTITLVIPFAPGGSTDIIGRVVARKLSEILKVNVVPENKGGAGGEIAANYVAHAAKDGYTIEIDHIGFSFNQSLYKNKGPVPEKEIVPVAFVGSTPNVLAVTNSLPVKTLPQFIAYAKAHPGAINYGSGGVGSAGHLSMELLQSVAGIKMTHVPYKGSGPALVDLISGRIQAMLLTIPAVMGNIKNGQVRAIATSGTTRPEALSDLPTFAQAGVKNFVYEPWYGIFAPRGTPGPVLTKLHAAVNKIVADPEVKRQLLQEGLSTKAKSRQAFVTQVEGDTRKWGVIIDRLGLNKE